jgi:serine/threonine-protein kinase HipA
VSTLAQVRLWGSTIGAVSIDGGGPAVFQYDPAFLASAIQLSPLRMPLRAAPYAFGALNRESFHGLPGLLADSLPDRYGSALIDAWLAGQGRRPESFDSVERLCYVGRRGMGALEFRPEHGPRASRNRDIHIDALVELASEVLTEREQLVASLAAGRMGEAMRDILSVGTSAGGARAKAVIAWNPETSEVRSGQLDAGPGFEHWLLKLDGVSGNKDRERLADPRGYGAIELAYAHMAGDAGIFMTECRLLEENGRRHFMTRRFDRDATAGKRHMQSLAALAHLDFTAPGAHSYEQAFQAIRELGLDAASAEQQFRRMVFNVVARNQDDHVKNIAFLMDRAGRWELSPAFDVAYAYNPDGQWTAQHQMSLAGKRDGFTLEDFDQVGRVAMLKRGQALRIVGEVTAVVSQWPRYANDVGVDEDHIRRITPALRLRLPRR